MTLETMEAGTDLRQRAGIVRTVIGGALMGIANIIPGVSGGTMILAMGLYESFVESVADLTRLRFRIGSILFLGILGGSAMVAILATVGLINWGLTYHQHIMFALFIGLTLGGVPLIWKEITPVRPSGLSGCVIGMAALVAVSLYLAHLDLPVNFAFLFIGGILGSAAMVLPGISGSYLLLAVGLYFPITQAIANFKDALKAADLGAATGPATGVLLPVGLGVLAGVAGLTNLLKAALHRYHGATLGTLLGLLLGSVIFLYPFKEPGHRDPFAAAAPLTLPNVMLVLLCIAAGFALTFYVSRLGNGEANRA